MALSSASPFNKYRNDYEVELQMRQAQQTERDCLAKGHIPTLSEKVHLDLKQNDLSEMTGIWEQWRRNSRDSFCTKYGHIAWLIYVHVDDQLLRAITQFWDPSYRCFVFNEVDMTSTIEEYSSLLHIDQMQPHKVYWRAQKTDHRRKLAKMLNITTEEVDQYLKKKGDTECLSWSFLNNYIKKHKKGEQGLLVFALAIYGLVIFPKILGHVEVSIINFFDQVTRNINPAPTIIAETLRSLNYYRRKGEGHFIGCAQLLPIWIKSHFECKVDRFQKSFLSSSCHIREFCESEWPICKRKKEWIAKLRRLISVEVTRRAPWMPRMQVMYKCGDEPWVSLMGPWGRVKDVVCLLKSASKFPVGLEPQDILLESELARRKLEMKMMNMKRRHEAELEEVKKEASRKVQKAFDEQDEWKNKFESSNATCSALVAKIQGMQTITNTLQNKIQLQEQIIQELRSDCNLMETAMEGYKEQYEANRQEYFRMREVGNSYKQDL
ncbi:Uncharacterized protein TCM_010942 [Theobroma cacao]|uniref:DUF7745 domain-containing protein n=1 Tax=Theobroma cacao TaxID=3641 RepID=A0A061E8P1_THECC|nr:Uncharacterized protein TCM_010942 [Theobroma cacao]